jgi:lactate permease
VLFVLECDKNGMTWTQDCDRFGVWWLSTLVAALPVVVLLGLLAVFRVKQHWAAMAGAAAVLIAASAVFQMPWSLSAASLLYGASFGLLRIGFDSGVDRDGLRLSIPGPFATLSH